MLFWPGCCCVPTDETAVSHCGCTFSPNRIVMVSSSHTVNGNMFQDDALDYEAAPAWASGGSFTSIQNPAWWSRNTFVSGGGTHYYVISCPTVTGNRYDLYRAYQAHPTFGAFLDGPRYTWTPGQPNNACSPWAMHGGTPYSGSGAVTITLDPEP
jgi:hypothetical protein